MKNAHAPRRLSLRLLLLLGTAFLLLAHEIVAAIPNLTTPIERIELSVRDSFMRLRGVQPPSEQIVIVAIDDFSFNWTGYRWPWPRTYLARIVDWLDDAGAEVIALDIFLFEADDEPGGDEALAAAIARAPHAVTVTQIFADATQGLLTRKLPLPIYRAGLDGIGTTVVHRDDDAIVRGVRAYQYYGDEIYFNWAFEVAAIAMGSEPPSNPSATGLTLNGETVPLNGGLFLIDYAGPSNTFPTFSAANVADGLEDPQDFAGKIVLIGATTMTLQDLYPTPFSASEQTPGVEIVANAINSLLNHQYLRLMPPWVSLVIILVMTLLAGLIIRTRRPGQTIGLMTAVLLGYFLIAYLVYLRSGWTLPVTGPLLMLFLGVLLPTTEQAVSQEVEKRRVRSLFTRFISPEMVDQLLATQDINSLNKRANLTILFSDIRGFTTLSEKLSPEDVVALLNPYLEVMTDVVHQHGGTVDKYEGDAIIAFFGEPVPYADHALRAARTAVEMRVRLAELRQRWKEEGRFSGRFEIGIGLNTGEAFVGLIGSAQRINYTIIGDNANLAARLQDMTKTYTWPIIISKSTAEAIQDEFEVEFVEATTVKGKREPVEIYKVLGRKGAPASERVRSFEN
ncbi:MAG: adenylate/guanylate cyclase domain-containing protein [Anaerolineales bacterium]|nr:adenylate/guanylate cyclase domain-containing protein [Anaerolineales bacterium]